MGPRDLFLNHYAFLVGIDEYVHFPDLRGAHSDATTLREALLWVGYPDENISLVSPEKTALDDLKEEIKSFPSKVGGQNLNPEILVFWAGHGVPGDDGGFLIARSTKRDPVDWRSHAVSLKWFAEQFRGIGPASLTMFFDVCHSVPSHQNDRRRYPRERILVPMRDAVRTTFVGVSTFAHEVSVWDKSRGRKQASAGILADAVQRAVRGERRDDRDHEPSQDSTFAVTDEDILYKLKEAVLRKAEEVHVYQGLSILTHYTNGQPSKVGFAVRSFAKKMLDELQLPVEADCLARIIVDREESHLDNLTGFGREIADFVVELIRQEITRDDYLQKERKLVCREILERRTDPNLAPYVYFLLHCREEAQRDNGAKGVLEEFYKYLLSGDPSNNLGKLLDGPYRTFAIRQALPWSCGIPVLDNDGKIRYAPVIYHGAPIIVGHDTQRTFITTALLQREALLDVWRTDASNSTLSGWPPNNCCHRVSGKFSKVMSKGKRVWVRIGLDVQGCEEKCRDQPSVSVPMKLMLGREGSSDCDWRDHWHLDLGARWPMLRGPQDLDSEPSWTTGLRRLMDECARSLNVLLTVSEGTREEGREDETTILVNWLYRADVTMRMLDESRLEHVVLELIAAWQDQPGRSVQWLSQSLRRTVGAESGTEEDRSNEQDDESSYWEVGEATLARYEQWLAEQHSKFLDPDVKRRVELLALLLQAVMAKESAEARVVDHLAYRSRSQTLRATFDQVVMAGTSPVPARAEQVIMWLAGAADQLLQEEGANLLPEQQAILQRWMQFASQAPKAGHSEDFLNEILDQMGESIGLGAWVLTRSFLSLSGEHSLAEDFRKEFDSLATQLRLGENQQEAREAAKRMYRLLKRLRHGQTNETVLEQGAGALLMFTSLLWPGGRKTALSILGTDASWTAAFRAVSEFVDPSQPNLMYGFQMEDNNRRISWIALLDSVISGLSDVDQIDQPELTADPITQAPSQAKFHAEGQYYQTLLAVPPGEALGL